MPRNLDLRRVDIDVGATRPFKALLVADAHLALADARENDPRKLALAAARGPWFRDAARFLDEAARRAREEGAIPLLAGDIWDFVSIRNIEAAKHVFAEGDWFACVGNHEFSQYVGEAREDEDYKAQSAERVASVWPNDTSFVSRAYPVSAWFRWFRDAGLEVVALEEPAEQAEGTPPYTSPEWAANEGELRVIPGTLIVVGRKKNP